MPNEISDLIHTQGKAERILYSVPDAAALLSLSARYIYLLIASGDIKATRIGSRTLIQRMELERFITSCSVKS